MDNFADAKSHSANGVIAKVRVSTTGTGEEGKGEEAEEEEQPEDEDDVGELEVISKHDPHMWSRKHISRLNGYEIRGGELNANTMTIGNKAFNAFRNALDRKGFVDRAAVELNY